MKINTKTIASSPFWRVGPIIFRPIGAGSQAETRQARRSKNVNDRSARRAKECVALFTLIAVTVQSAAGAQFVTAKIGGGPLGTIADNGGGSFTVEGGGGAIWDMADEFTFHYIPVNGDFDVRARVESVEVTARWTTAGLMVRESVAGDSRMAYSKVTPHGPIVDASGNPVNNCGQFEGEADVSFTYRTWIPGQGDNGGQHEDRLVPHPGYPTYRWIRLQRVGDVVRAFASADGINWSAPQVQNTAFWVSPVGGSPTPFAKNALLGIAVSRHGCTEETQPGGTAHAEFRDLAIQPPVVVTQPANASVTPGGPASFSVTLGGSYTSVQWQKDTGAGFADIPGERSINLSIPLVTLADDQTAFRVTIVNEMTEATVTSSAATLSVVAPPSILTQPVSLTTNVGQTVTFTVVATEAGGGGLTYQWRKNGVNLSDGGKVSGATSATLSLTGVQSTDAGDYSVVVMNAAGGVTSLEATLTIAPQGTDGIVFYEDFSDISELQFNGNTTATNTADGGVLRLTPAATNQAGSAFLKTPISVAYNASFSTFFSFRLSQGGPANDADGVPGADGIAFVVLTNSNSLIPGGGGIGYQGISTSVAVEFDTFYNFGGNDHGDADGNHVAIHVNGSPPAVGYAPVAPALNGGDVWYAWIDYYGATELLEVRLSTISSRPVSPTLTATVNVLNTIGTSNAFFGFTAATGALFNQQDILSWEMIVFDPVNVWTGASGTDLLWTTAANWSSDIVPDAGNVALFTDTGATNNNIASVNNIVPANHTVGWLNYSQTSSSHHTLIAPGATLTVQNSLLAGTETITNIVITNRISGSGAALVVGDGSADSRLIVRQAGAANAAHRATLDLSGLDNFTANVGRVLVGVGTGGPNRATGRLILAKTNVITASSATVPAFDIGDSSNNGGNATTLVLGQTNAIFADTITIGRGKEGGVNMFFNSAGSSAYFRGANGVGRVTTFAIADGGNVTATVAALATVNFSSGSVNASIDLLAVGRGSTALNTVPFASTTGTLTFDQGIIDANTVLVGANVVNSTNSGRGTINVNGAALLVANSVVELGRTVNPVAGGNTVGTLNINGGTVWANNITNAGAGTANVTMNNGTLVLSNTLGSAALPVTSLSLTNATLHLWPVVASPVAIVSDLLTDGAANIINIAAVPGEGQYQLIKYVGPFGGAGFNFVLGNLPVNFTGYLSNNVANSSIDLVVISELPPTITAQPQSQAVCAGGMASFTVAATGSPPLNYQWRKGGQDLSEGGRISGATTATLTLTGVQAGDAGSYDVVVANAVSSVTSSAATLTVNPRPTANAGTDRVICSGNSTTMGGAPTASDGTGPYTYLWSPATGLNNATVANPTASPTSTTTYTVTVTDANGCTGSDSALVTVNASPTANAGTDKTICSGSSTAIGGSPTAGGGSGPFTYLWSPATGLDDATVANPTASPASTTTYTVTVSDANGCTGSDSALVTVVVSEEIFPLLGTVWKYLDDGSNQGTLWRMNGFNDSTWASGPAELGYGDGDEATVVSFGPAPNNKHVTTYFRHAFNIQNPETITSLLIQLKRDDGVIVYLNGTYVLHDNMPGSFADFTTFATATAPDDGNQIITYLVPPALLVAGNNVIAAEVHQSSLTSSDISFALGLIKNVSCQVTPSITAQPQSRTKVVGTTAAFSVSATGIAPLNYQWQKGGINLSDTGNILGATSSTLSIVNVQLANAGDYTVVVTNMVGSVTSVVATLIVQMEFNDFAAQYSLPPDQDDPEDDADGDGILNVFEFYFGSNPTNAASGAEPTGTVVSDSGQEYPAITFVRSKAAGGVTLLTEVSSDVNFTNPLGSVLESVEDLGDGMERVTIRSAASSASQNPQFLRIRLSLP